jgi:hypothetical protein
MCDNGTVETDGIWVKVYRRAQVDGALHPVARSGVTFSGESTHHYGDVD